MKKSAVFKVLRIVKNVICWLLLIVFVATMAVVFISKINGEPPVIFGYSIYRVSSPSMTPELLEGDVILDQVVDDPMSLKVGDNITFKGSGNTEGKLITHKIIVAPQYENGVLKLQTKGIANEIPDKPITVDRIKGKMVCKLEFLNIVYEIFLSPWGLIILIALILVIFIDEIIVIVRILTGNDKDAKDADDINEIIDRLQAEKQAQALEEKKKQGEKSDESQETAKAVNESEEKGEDSDEPKDEE